MLKKCRFELRKYENCPFLAIFTIFGNSVLSKPTIRHTPSAHCTNAQIKRNANAVRPSLIICPRILEHRSQFLVVVQLIPRQTRTEIS